MSIRISPKHGVNPMVMLCFYCNKPSGAALLGHVTQRDERGVITDRDVEAPRRAVVDRQPCDKCVEHMKIGIILISIRDGGTRENPYRTGGWVVVTEEAFNRWFANADNANPLPRAAFVTDTIWDRLGLPRGPVGGVPSE